jgi:NADPH:quinone reductase-like Zn-dependent oxidoreductase
VPVTYTAMVMAGPGELPQPEERDVPEPAPGEAVVRIRASSMNFHDVVNLRGLIKGPWPRVPMTDGCGEVVAVADGVRNVATGDRVIAAFHPLWLQGPPTPEVKRVCPGDTGDGCLQQYLRITANALVRVPGHLSDTEAATLPCAGVTAWSALRAGGLEPGQVVVAQGTGGVSLFVVQLAKLSGATVVLTSSSDEKLAIGASLGADHLINYRADPEWHRTVRAITGGRGADLVVDVAGPQTLGKSVLATRMGGFVAITGVLSGVGDAQVPVSYAMTRNIRLGGVTVGSVADHEALCRAIEVSGIRPHISHTLPWDRLDEAMRLLDANEHVGKVAITVP